MKIVHAFALSLLVGTTLVACGGGGRANPLGTQCGKNIDPIPIDIAPTEKGSIETGIPGGDYEYAGAELYFIEDTTDFRILVRDAQQRNGQFKADVECVRNAGKRSMDVSFRVPGLSALKVDSSNKTSFDVKEFGFRTENTVLVAVADPIVDGKPQSPKDVYASENVRESFVFKPQGSDVDVQIRSTGTIEGGTYYLQVRFRKIGPAPAATDP